MNIKKRVVILAMLSLLSVPIMTNNFLYAPKVLAEETTTSEKTSTADSITSAENSASIVEKESVIIADSSVYYVQIGYEFEDGSFDIWAKGTAFLVSNQDLLTVQSLADTSTSSNLYKAILEKKSDAYKTAGIDLRDETEVEKRFVVKVTDSDGNLLAVKDTAAKNGLGLITLDKVVTSNPGIFEEEENVNLTEGTKYKLKVSSLVDKKASIKEVEGTLVKPASNAVGGTLAMTANTTDSEPVGAPIYNNNGYIIGMVSGEGESLTVVPTNGLQNFLTGQGVSFDTKTTAEKKQEAEEKTAEEQVIEDANKASVTTKKLESAIKKAEEVESSQYTDDSYKALTSALTAAKKVKDDENHSQAEIDSATKKLNDAYKSLEEVSLIDKLFIPIIIGVVVLCGAITTGLILSKRKKGRQLPNTKNGKPVVSPKDESDFSGELLRSMDEADLGSNQRERVRPTYEEPIVQRRNEQGVYEDVNAGLDVTDQIAPIGLRTGNTNIPGVTFADESPSEPTNLAGQRYGIPVGPVNALDEGEEETTVLGKSSYLVKKDDGTEIPLRDGFIIGKERRKVHYCIQNPSVSRNHAQFRIIDGEFYIEDLQSKNYTYLNGIQLPAYKAAKLADGDIVKMSDVEFTFHK